MAGLKGAELIERPARKAASYLERGDAVQSSEKLYEVAEECVKSPHERDIR